MKQLPGFHLPVYMGVLEVYPLPRLTCPLPDLPYRSEVGMTHKWMYIQIVIGNDEDVEKYCFAEPT